MDPHQRPVRDWNYEYLPNAIDAYHEARINSYVFNQDVGELSKEELNEIASYPPSVDFKRYSYYAKLTKEQLEKEFPFLSIIIPGITHEDLFWYATRSYIPNYDSINYKIERYNRYNDLSLGKTLMDNLYEGNYWNSMGHELEKYIIAYDQNIDNESALRSIAERLSIDLTSDDVQSELFEILYHKTNKK